jgi:taurine--2-oxoglutarate transaminase
LTYSAHALACAVGIANIEVYKDEKLIENSRQMGKVLRAGLLELAENHACVGDVRGIGLHQVIELVADRATRKPMSGFNQPLGEAMRAVAVSLREQGMSTFVRWNWVFSCPPLVITEEQIQEGIAMIGEALNKVDRYYEGDL